LTACLDTFRRIDSQRVHFRDGVRVHGIVTGSGQAVNEVAERMGYKSMQNNLTLARRFGAALAALGRPASEADPSAGAGSTDMGDISHAVPSIHPHLAICDQGHTLCHQHAFAACARSERGYDTAVVAAKAMARTAADLLEDSGCSLP
jgi:metal-dependent amidase/aminoacylase/carboxypeptidase family protein